MFYYPVFPGYYRVHPPPPTNCFNSGAHWNVCIDNEYASPDCAIITYTTDLTHSDFDGQSYPIYAHVTTGTKNIGDEINPIYRRLIFDESSPFDLVDEYYGSEVGGSDEKYIYVFKIESGSQMFTAKFKNSYGAAYRFNGTNIRFRTDISPNGTEIVKYLIPKNHNWYNTYIDDFINLNSGLASPLSYDNDKINILAGTGNIFFIDNTNLTIENNSVVYIDPDVVIEVKDGSTLEITDSEVRGCDRMWEAIEVESGGTLIIKNSTIQDGYQAIKVNPGANITLEDNTFLNNYIGLYADDAVSSQPITIDDVRSNIFKTDNNEGFLEVPTGKSSDPFYFDPKSKSYAGLYFKDSKVEFMTSLGLGNDDLNLFQKLHHGVVVDNAEVDIKTCKFRDILDSEFSNNENEGAAVLQKGGSLKHSGYSTLITETLFDNCKYGLLAKEAGLTSFRFHSLNNCQTAIRAENTQFLASLDFNDITNSETGIYILDHNRVTTNVNIGNNDISVYYRGIVSAGMAAKIRGNSVTLDATGLGFNDLQNSVGIQVSSIAMSPDHPVHSSRRTPIIANEVTVNKGKRGIAVIYGHSFHILDNTVIFNDHIYSSGSQSSGIFLLGGGNHRVKGNCVDNFDDETGSGYQAIFRNIFSEQSNGVLMQCNFASTGKAYSKNLINIVGINAISDIRGNMLPEQESSTNTYTTDLQLGTDDNGRCLLGEQDHTGNLWLYPLSSSSAYSRATHKSSFQQDYIQSGFYMDQTANHSLPSGYSAYEYKAEPNTGDYQWIHYEPVPQGKEIFECEKLPFCLRETSDTLIAIGDDLPPITVDPLLQDIMDGDATMNDSLYNFLWIGQRYLITEVKHAVVRNYTSIALANFASNYANSDFGQLSKIRADLSAELYESDSILADEIGYWSESFTDIDSLNWDNIDQNVVELTDSLRNVNWTDFKTSTNQVSTSNTCGYNEIDVNLAFADNALDTASSSQIEDMEELSLQCPYVEGTAVYEAKAFLEYLGLPTDSINNCGSQATTAGLREYNPKEKKEKDISAKIYPNPASNHININLDRADPGEYYIYNSIGQLVKNGICTPTDKISLTGINSGGLYYIQLVEENGNSETLSFYIEK